MQYILNLTRSLLVILVFIGVAGQLNAQEIPRPTEDIILTVTGSISNTNSTDKAEFDRPMLENIGMVEITTMTPWYDDEITFSGVPISRFMEFIDADGEQITALALNDYSVNIPIPDAEQMGAILATRIDGEILSVRDRGPIFIIYPFDSRPDLQSQTYYARSAWQVNRLVIQ